MFTAQTTESIKDTFKPNGKLLVTIASDLKYNMAFKFSRADFGYNYNFNPNFSSEVVFDMANSAGLSPSAFTAFLKNAYVEYGDQFLKVNFGIIGTSTFNLQESMWGVQFSICNLLQTH